MLIEYQLIKAQIAWLPLNYVTADLKDFTAGSQGKTWVHNMVINQSLKGFWIWWGSEQLGNKTKYFPSFHISFSPPLLSAFVLCHKEVLREVAQYHFS